MYIKQFHGRLHKYLSQTGVYVSTSNHVVYRNQEQIQIFKRLLKSSCHSGENVMALSSYSGVYDGCPEKST